MSKEGLETLPGGEVPDLDGVIQRPRGKTVAHRLNALNLPHVTLKHLDTLFGAKVPEPDGHVIRAAQQKVVIVYDHRVHPIGVATKEKGGKCKLRLKQLANREQEERGDIRESTALALEDVPHLDFTIHGTADQPLIIIIQAQNSVKRGKERKKT